MGICMDTGEWVVGHDDLRTAFDLTWELMWKQLHVVDISERRLWWRSFIEILIMKFHVRRVIVDVQ